MTMLTGVAPAATPDIWVKEEAKKDVAAHIGPRLITEIEQALRSAGYHSLCNVHVSLTADGILLRGAVSTFFMKQIAQELALRAGLGRAVRNEIQVV